MNENNHNSNLIYDLHHAAATGNVGLVKFALDHGAPIDCVINGLMPLQVACVSDNNMAAVQYLIDRGAQVNAQRWHKKEAMDKSQPTGSTALHVACANGCTRIVDLLLRNGASVRLKDKYGTTPIDVASAKGGHVEMTRKLLETAAAASSRFPRGRMDKPLPIPIQSTTQSGSIDDVLPQPQPQPNSLPELSSPSSNKSNVLSSSVDDWYGVGVVNKYDKSEHYLQVLERRLSGSFDEQQYHGYRLDGSATGAPAGAAKLESELDYSEEQGYYWHLPVYALQMSLDSLNKASRSSLDVLSKKPDYDMSTIASESTTAAAAAAAAAATGNKPSVLSRFLIWPWRKARSLPIAKPI